MEKDKSRGDDVLRIFCIGRAILLSEAIMNASNRYPKELARVQLFSSLSIPEQILEIAEQGGRRTIESPWCECRVYGAVTLKDEDVLIAMIRLAAIDKFYMGNELQAYTVPIDIDALYDDPWIHHFICTYSDIEKELGYKRGGRTRKELKLSIERLNTLTIFKDTKSGKTESINILHASSYVESPNTEAQLRLVFTPWFLRNFLKGYLILDSDIRTKLRPIGRQIYSFLADQNGVFHIEIEKLIEVIGYTGSVRSFKKPLRETLDTLMNFEHSLMLIKYYRIYRKDKSVSLEQNQLLVVFGDATESEVQEFGKKIATISKKDASRQKRAKQWTI